MSLDEDLPRPLMATAAKPTSTLRSYADPIDSDWEYEYDEHETEDVYFILDLTSHDPDALDDRKTAIDINTESPRPSNPSLPAALEPQLQRQRQQQTEAAATLQILGLHTTQPLIKFGPDVYSGSWSTDLGTAVHVAPAGYVPDPLWAGGTVDVVATSRARLLGRPAVLKPKRAPRSTNLDNDQGGTEDAAIVIDDNDNNHDDNVDNDADAVEAGPAAEPVSTPTPLVVPVDLRRTDAQDRQAAFLERLSAIKLKKGETDPVGAYLDRSYQIPPGADVALQNLPGPDEDNALRAPSAGPSTKRKRSFENALD